MPSEPTSLCPNNISITNGKTTPKNVTHLSPMNGGNDINSYYENSYYQRVAATFEWQKIREEIMEKFNIDETILTPTSKTTIIRIADLGCATGPNTFLSVQNIIESIKQKNNKTLTNSATRLEFEVFFNDLVENDFNTLFSSLPKEKDYFAAAVAGSFRGELFPESSLHLAYTCHSLHWLSEVPAEVGDSGSPAWNKGRVHCTGAPEGVVEAYRGQFRKEMEMFLRARAKELVGGGMLFMIFNGVSHDEIMTRSGSTANSATFEFMASILMDMVQEGMIKESEVDSFNLPLYNSATPEEIKGLVEKNGCFSIERLELSKPCSWLKVPVDIRAWMKHVRAAMEGSFVRHFGSKEVVDQLFTRLTKKHLDHSHMLHHWCNQKVQFFVVLKRFHNTSTFV